LYDPHVTGWKGGAVIPNWTQLQTNAWKDGQEAEWLSISGSGFNIINKPNSFPLRKHDIVIEAHDGEGNTSAGNKLYQGTLFDAIEANFNTSALGIDKTYDILGVNLAAPESVRYTQITGEKGNWNKKTQYLSPENAYLNDLPYLAQAYIYPDGWLQANILLSQSTTGSLVEIDGVAQDEEEIDNRFNNAEGMVYYYTTGDNSVIYNGENPQLANPAPAFNLNDAFFDSNDNAGTVQQLSKNGEDNIAFGGIVNVGKASNQGGTSAVPQGNVHRGFYLFSDSDSMEALRIPFPNINRAKVHNIQLSYALFDELHLLSAFESDGSTPKITKKENINPALSNVETVKNIFTEKDMNFSQATAPLVSDTMMAASTFSPNTDGVSQSIYLTESSVQSAGDAALGFRAWGSINIIRGGALKTLGLRPTDDFKGAILDTEWPDGRKPVVLKTFTTNDIQSITSKFGGYGLLRIILKLKLPPEIDKENMSVIANGYYAHEGITCTVEVDTHSEDSTNNHSSRGNQIEITYKYAVTEYAIGHLRHEIGGGWTRWLNTESEDPPNGFTLFFGILVTNE
jgi:hypothetical protein